MFDVYIFFESINTKLE